MLDQQTVGKMIFLCLKVLTSSYRLSQIIFDPTHILSNSSSCIDVIFTNQANVVTETGVYLS